MVSFVSLPKWFAMVAVLSASGGRGWLRALRVLCSARGLTATHRTCALPSSPLGGRGTTPYSVLSTQYFFSPLTPNPLPPGARGGKTAIGARNSLQGAHTIRGDSYPLAASAAPRLAETSWT